VAVDVVNDSDAQANGNERGSRKDLHNVRAGFRIDPLNSSKSVQVKQNEDGSFEVGTGKRPSEINHGNIPFETPNAGIRFRYAEQTTVISLGALRKLRFPLDGKDDPNVNNAGRAVLAALGLCAGVLAAEANTSLRSRCHLWPVEEREWELLERPGQSPRRFRIGSEAALALLKEAVANAEELGLSWKSEKVLLKPSPELAKLVQQSQEMVAKEKGEGEAK
jgi:CRISPR-associated protein Csb1